MNLLTHIKIIIEILKKENKNENIGKNLIFKTGRINTCFIQL